MPTYYDSSYHNAISVDTLDVNTIERINAAVTVTGALTVSGLSTFNGNAIVADATDNTKQLKFSLSGMTTGVALTLSSTQSTAQTLSIPNITGADTIATLGIAQTFTALTQINKLDDESAIVDGADNTKALGFNLAPATTATTLTLTGNQTTSQILNVPNLTATDTLATLGLGNIFTGVNQFNANVTFGTGTASVVTIGDGTTNSSLNFMGVTSNPSPAANTWSLFTSSGKNFNIRPGTANLFQIWNASGGQPFIFNTSSNLLTLGTSGNIALTGSSTGITTIATANAGASNFTFTVPNFTDTAAVLGSTQTFTGAITMNKLVAASSIVDGSDNTKTITFNISGMTTGKTLTIANSQTNSFTLTIPNITASDTVATLGLAQTFTGQPTFPTSGIIINNQSGGGTTTLNAQGNASSFTITLPSQTATLATLSTQTWTGQQTFAKASATPVLITYSSAPTGGAGAYQGGLAAAANTVGFVTTPQTGDYSSFLFGIATLTNPSSGTIGNAATLKIVGSPTAGSNVTITNGYALWVAAGTTALAGSVNFGSSGQAIVNASGLITKYNNISTQGAGVPTIVASAITGSVSTTQTNLINYTPPAATGTYRMHIFVSNTSGTNTGTWTPSIAYKSSGGQTTFAPNFEQTNSASFALTVTGASKDFSSTFIFGIDNSATAITLTMTVSGTVASFINATLEQLA